jgi:hypothetical protein
LGLPFHVVIRRPMVLARPSSLHPKHQTPLQTYVIRLIIQIRRVNAVKFRAATKLSRKHMTSFYDLKLRLHVIESFPPSQSHPSSGNCDLIGSVCHLLELYFRDFEQRKNEFTAPRSASREDAAFTKCPFHRTTPIRKLSRQVSATGQEAGWTSRQCLQPRKSCCKGPRSSYKWYVRNKKSAKSSPADQLNRSLAKTIYLVRTRPLFPLFPCVKMLTIPSVVIPCLILGSINAYNLWNEHWEHWSHLPPLEERVEYPYQNIRTKNFFWGDGDKVSTSRKAANVY